MPTIHQKVAPQIIVVDWGTTSFRAFLVGVEGIILGEIETGDGISTLSGDTYETALTGHISPWHAEHGLLPVIALGMVTSRNGWVEVPYVSCPANAKDLAAGTHRVTLANGAPLVFLAGLTDTARQPFPDVMRGEETQILGFGLEDNATVVLPGTHSKWARIRNGMIDSFQSFVTGEVYALLANHSFIARGAAPAMDGEPDWSAFGRGVSTVLDGDVRSNAFLSLIFSARTGMLAQELKPSEILDYVSGLVIGHEFHEAFQAGWINPGDTIGIVGNDGLNARYARAAKLFGLGVHDGGEDAAIAGALQIAAVLDFMETCAA